MVRPNSKNPTELELEILKIIWANGPKSGRELQEQLSDIRKISYQSVMTILGIMETKKYVRRKKTDGRFVYSARITEKSTRKRILRDVVDRVYEGSIVATMVNLLESSKIDSEEIEQLRKIVNQKKEQQP